MDADERQGVCPNHDRLFDGGWITFGDDGKIRISQALDASERKAMGVDDTMTISVQEENKKYMEFHREHIFKT